MSTKPYRALWSEDGQFHRPYFVQCEPDQAKQRCYRLLAWGHPFVVEIAPTKIKDMVIVNQGAKWEEEKDKNDYIPQRALTFDDAAQYLTTLIDREYCFAVEPQQMPDTTRKEWVFTVQLHRR